MLLTASATAETTCRRNSFHSGLFTRSETNLHAAETERRVSRLCPSRSSTLSDRPTIHPCRLQACLPRAPRPSPSWPSPRSGDSVVGYTREPFSAGAEAPRRRDRVLHWPGRHAFDLPAHCRRHLCRIARERADSPAPGGPAQGPGTVAHRWRGTTSVSRIRNAEVSFHAPRRGEEYGAGARFERRPAHHQGGQGSTTHATRRAAAVLERSPGTHEPGGAPPRAAGVGGAAGDGNPLLRGAHARRQAGHHGPRS